MARPSRVGGFCQGARGATFRRASRPALETLTGKVQGRSVFDVNRGTAICVHDWVVPAAEELLELALFLQLPGHETAVNTLPEPHAAI
jgi:hypothetical protein